MGKEKTKKNKDDDEKSIEISTEISNLDKVRYQIITNDKNVVKFLKSQNLEQAGNVLKQEIGLWTKAPTGKFINYNLYFFSEISLIEHIEKICNENSKSFQLIIHKEKRQRRNKKDADKDDTKPNRRIAKKTKKQTN